MSDERVKQADVLVLRDALPLPSGLTLAVEPSAGAGYRDAGDDRGVLVLTRRRAHCVDFGLWAFASGWLAFSIWMFAGIVLRGERGLACPAAFMGCFVVIGVAMMHEAITNTFNRMVITVGRGRLTLRHGPIPPYGEISIDAREMEQLFVRLNVGSEGPDLFDVLVQRPAKPPLVLVRGLPTLEQAQHIERAIEAHLRIADVSVADEVPKK